MNNKKGNNSGFSLVELLIAIAILTVVIVPLARSFVSANKVNSKSKRTLYATEMAQNVFEGIASGDAEETMMQLSAANGEFGFLPNDFTFTSAGESDVALVADPVTGKQVPLLTNGEFTITPNGNTASYYTTTRLLDNGDTDYLGFKENDSMVYSFWMQGLKQTTSKQEFDLRLTFVGSNNNLVDLEHTAQISSVNQSYDTMYMENATTFADVVSNEYKYKRIKGTSGKSEKDLLASMKRTYVIDVKQEPSSGGREIVVDISTLYEYGNAADIAMGHTAEYAPPTERIYTSKTYGQDPRNIYLYYTPNYKSTVVGGELDNFIINNPEDLNINIYIIRMKQVSSAGDVFAGTNITTETSEIPYAATVTVNETDKDNVNTKIRTNLSDNIAIPESALRVGDTMNFNLKLRNPDKITYNFDSPIIGADIRELLDVKTLDAQTEGNRTYDVTVEVYSKGAYQSGFPKEDRVAKFTGSIVQ